MERSENKEKKEKFSLDTKRLFYGWVLFEIRISEIKVDKKKKSLIVMNVISDLIA